MACKTSLTLNCLQRQILIHSSPLLTMASPIATDIQSTIDTEIGTFSDGLSVNGVAARRSMAPKMAGGIAAHASSDMFKGPVRLSPTSCLKVDGLTYNRDAENQKLRGGIVRSSTAVLDTVLIGEQIS